MSITGLIGDFFTESCTFWAKGSFYAAIFKLGLPVVDVMGLLFIFLNDTPPLFLWTLADFWFLAIGKYLLSSEVVCKGFIRIPEDDNFYGPILFFLSLSGPIIL